MTTTTASITLPQEPGSLAITQTSSPCILLVLYDAKDTWTASASGYYDDLDYNHPKLVVDSIYDMKEGKDGYRAPKGAPAPWLQIDFGTSVVVKMVSLYCKKRL